MIRITMIMVIIPAILTAEVVLVIEKPSAQAQVLKDMIDTPESLDQMTDIPDQAEIMVDTTITETLDITITEILIN